MPVSDAQITLNDILKDQAITPYFQPLFDLTNGQLYGHEALARGPENSHFFFPDALFTSALQTNQLHELEILCRQKSIQRFSELQLPNKLFLNVSASLLSSSYHQTGMTLAILKERNLSQENIVIELSEQHPYDHEGLTLSAMNHYRQMGFQVAIDDLGVGYSGLRLWSELQPEIVKIDKHFIRNIDTDNIKQEFVRSIVAIANRLHCKIIAEGIETEGELDQLLDLGVTLGQGFLLGRPTPLPTVFTNDYLKAHFISRRNLVDASETVLALAKPVPSVQHDSLLIEAGALFKQDPNLIALPVLDGSQPLGIIRRHQLHELFSTPYGRALYENKTVTHLMSNDVLIVESFISLSSVSLQLTNQDVATLNNEIIVVKQGSYLGMGSLRDVLKCITELRVQNATYSNPLTLLPGNVPITREVSRRLAAGLDFHVAYFDLNDFKPFNDYFGYATGDEVIQLLGRIIHQHLPESDDFIGHIGGDDFVVIFTSHQWEIICETILDDFAQQVQTFYDTETLEIGGVWCQNRQGDTIFHAILSLAIGVVHPDSNACKSHHEVAELAAQAKKAAKKNGGNTLYICPNRKVNHLLKLA